MLPPHRATHLQLLLPTAPVPAVYPHTSLTCKQCILLLLSSLLRHLAQLHHRRNLRPTKHCIALSRILPLALACSAVFAAVLGGAASSAKGRHGRKEAARLRRCVAAKQAATASAAICRQSRKSTSGVVYRGSSRWDNCCM